MTMTTELDGFIQGFGTQAEEISVTWNWTERGVAIFRGQEVVCEFATAFPSRDGLRLVDAIVAAGAGARAQVSHHGLGRVSVQVFAADGKLCSDVNVGGNW